MHHSRVLTFGEAMILLDPESSGPIDLGSDMKIRFAGAESNFAIGLSRLGIPTEWISRLGNDRFGHIIVSTLEEEGVDVRRCTIDETRPTGLFLKWREGTMTHRQYYRDGSAAAALVSNDVLPLRGDWLHLTGITMGLSASAERAVYDAAHQAKSAGLKVSFDVNYRPSQWESSEAARKAALRVLPFADWVFCGIEEGREVFGAIDPADLHQIIAQSGASGSLIRVGAEGAWVTEEGTLTSGFHD